MKHVCFVLLTVSALLLAALAYASVPVVSVRTSTIESFRAGQKQAIALPSRLTAAQVSLLEFAYTVAKNDGYLKPQWLQGIILQETKAGNMERWRVSGLQNAANDRYFGIGQLKLAAAQDVMKAYPELWSHLDTRTVEELQARLVLDDRFNIRVASKYALLMGINKDPVRAVGAYNQGPLGVNVRPDAAQAYSSSVAAYTSKLAGKSSSLNIK